MYGFQDVAPGEIESRLSMEPLIGQAVVVGDARKYLVALLTLDPDTGEVLDESMTEFAQLKVEQVKEKLSICSVVSGDTNRIAKGTSIHD